jgi:hypothetical protein
MAASRIYPEILKETAHARGTATDRRRRASRYGQQRRESDVLMAGQPYVTLLSRRLFLQASVGLVPSGWLLNSLAAEESSLPPDAEPVEAVRAFTPGPAKRYVFWTGQMRDFRMFRYWRDRYTCDDFAFVFSSPQHGEWLVISREPTPWYSWRLGANLCRGSGWIASGKPASGSYRGPTSGY